jgi:hypothetical protein
MQDSAILNAMRDSSSQIMVARNVIIIAKPAMVNTVLNTRLQ